MKNALRAIARAITLSAALFMSSGCSWVAASDTFVISGSGLFIPPHSHSHSSTVIHSSGFPHTIVSSPTWIVHPTPVDPPVNVILMPNFHVPHHHGGTTIIHHSSTIHRSRSTSGFIGGSRGWIAW